MDGHLYIKINYYLFYTLIAIFGTAALIPRIIDTHSKNDYYIRKIIIPKPINTLGSLVIAFVFFRFCLISIHFPSQLVFYNGTPLETCYKKVIDYHYISGRYSKHIFKIKKLYNSENLNQEISFGIGYFNFFIKKNTEYYLKLDFTTFYFGTIYLKKAKLIESHTLPKNIDLNKQCFDLH